MQSADDKADTLGAGLFFFPSPFPIRLAGLVERPT
jgi:hypothetical protein